MTQGRTGADGMADERLPLRQAAARLGVSESAIRKRVERGTLRSDKAPDGRRYIYLDSVTDTGADASATHERDALISEMRAHNETLREQLEAERQAHAEARRIIAGLVERIPPQIEPPRDEREAPETVDEQQDMGQPRSDAPGPQDGVRRPWWRRMFGG
jgi:predicted  nucleic acid-binding Zn-ribbon protein